VPTEAKESVVGPLPPHKLFRDWLPAADHAALLDWTLRQEAEFEPTTIVRGDIEVVDPESRKSSRLPRFGPLKEAFVEHVRSRADEIFQACGTRPFDVGRVEVEIAAHNDGAHFHPHTDIPIGTLRQPLEGNRSYDRVVSAVYYFHQEPKGFSGGELRLHRFGGSGGKGEFVDIAPEQNSLVVFPSWARHEVLRVSCPSGRFSDSRFAVNCWLHRKRAD
jgi:SM-20-related protein